MLSCPIDNLVTFLNMHLKGYSFRKGPKYASKMKKAATDLTREHLLRDEWRELEFKEYNLSAQVQPIQIGYLRPLLKVWDTIQNIYLRMGFEEMPTNNYVESSSSTRELPEGYVDKVKRAHAFGDYGSIGKTFNPKGYYSIDSVSAMKLWIEPILQNFII